jgi:hypothetical protein
LAQSFCPQRKKVQNVGAAMDCGALELLECTDLKWSFGEKSGLAPTGK